MSNFYPKVLASHLEELPSWMTSWKLDEEGKRKIYSLLADSFKKDALLEKEELSCLIEFLKLSPDASDAARLMLDRAISIALRNYEVIDFEDLIGSCCKWIPAALLEIINVVKSGDLVKGLAEIKPKYTAALEAKYGK